VLMADDSCYSDMLCFTNYIAFLSHDVGGEEVNQLLYNFKVGW